MKCLFVQINSIISVKNKKIRESYDQRWVQSRNKERKFIWLRRKYGKNKEIKILIIWPNFCFSLTENQNNSENDGEEESEIPSAEDH